MNALFKALMIAIMFLSFVMMTSERARDKEKANYLVVFILSVLAYLFSATYL